MHGPYFEKVAIKVVGDSGVGKTSIIERYINDKFSKDIRPTIGVDYFTKNMIFGKNEIKLVIWDTAGMEEFRNITSHYYKNTDAIFLVFALNNRRSFENIERWLEEFNEKCDNPNAVVILIGNKYDLKDREVSIDEGELYAKKNRLMYAEVSASTSWGINDLFEETTKKVIDTYRKCKTSNGNNYSSQLLDTTKTESKRGLCCYG